MKRNKFKSKRKILTFFLAINPVPCYVTLMIASSGTETLSAQITWTAVLGELEVKLPQPTYQTWLKDTVGISVSPSTFLVGVPNAFTAEWLEKRLYHLVQQTVSKISGMFLDVRFSVLGTSRSATDSGPTADPATNIYPTTSFVPHERYSFDSFVVGPSNHLSFASAEAVASADRSFYNPLFIYSGVGLGKTHLLHAIARRCIEQRINFLYVTSEQFTNEYIRSIRERTTEEFRARCRSVDILLMDDIQFMQGKDQTLEGFFHTFNDLHNASRQVVITSDQAPNTMPYLEDRLRSRFSWGLITDIQRPALETRIAILQTKAKERFITVNNDVIYYIAEHVDNSVRDLEGALHRLDAISRVTNQPITIDLAQQSIQCSSSSEVFSSFSPESVICAVEDVFNIDHNALIGPNRDRELVTARQTVMYILREYLNLSVSHISRLVGGKHHATIIHGIKRISTRIASDSHLRSKLQDIQNLLSKQSR